MDEQNIDEIGFGMVEAGLSAGFVLRVLKLARESEGVADLVHIWGAADVGGRREVEADLREAIRDRSVEGLRQRVLASLIKDNPTYAPPAEAPVPAPPAESRVPLRYLRPAQNWWMVAAVAREVDRQHRGGQLARIDDDDLLDMVVRALLRFAKDRKAAMAASLKGEGS